MKVEIVTPEMILYKGEVRALSVPGINGEFQMLENHAPIISVLTVGNVKLYGDINS
ncbi:ATP synthase epsilon chain (fragment) [Capnocytophaga canimorsus]|uniref:ATP synthase epsilon chain n=1 Tax=Capnocytophaga canimorsus TaxID=28188 RepID=A0A0B7INF5_9FLAO